MSSKEMEHTEQQLAKDLKEGHTSKFLEELNNVKPEERQAIVADINKHDKGVTKGLPDLTLTPDNQITIRSDKGVVATNADGNSVDGKLLAKDMEAATPVDSKNANDALAKSIKEQELMIAFNNLNPEQQAAAIKQFNEDEKGKATLTVENGKLIETTNVDKTVQGASEKPNAADTTSPSEKTAEQGQDKTNLATEEKKIADELKAGKRPTAEELTQLLDSAMKAGTNDGYVPGTTAMADAIKAINKQLPADCPVKLGLSNDRSADSDGYHATVSMSRKDAGGQYENDGNVKFVIDDKGSQNPKDWSLKPATPGEDYSWSNVKVHSSATKHVEPLPPSTTTPEQDKASVDEYMRQHQQ